MIRILATAFAALLGLAFGSFLNVCLSRWPEGESIVSPRSHCRNCDHVLSWWENIPLLSWIILRGRCRRCHTAISWRYPLVELMIGTLWAFSVWQAFQKSPNIPGPLNLALQSSSHHPIVPMIVVVVIGQAVFTWCMVALAALDAENLWLPNLLTIPGIILGFGFSVFGIYEASWRPEIIWHCCVIPKFDRSLCFDLSLATAVSILAAAALILLIRWLYQLIRHQEGLGLGDAKLMALLAAWLGLPGALLAFVLGTILAALAGLYVIAVPSARTNPQSWATSKLPLGTFLCIGGIVSSLWGEPIIAAYLRWAGF